MLFEQLLELFKEFPTTAKNGDDEYCIIERGRNGNGEYVSITTFQNNERVRTNYYYENGYTEELYGDWED